jgi:ATP-dependent Clp protease adaptor protein ClpS
MPEAIIDDKVKDKTHINLGRPHNVILFNDTTHSFDEVISQIVKAIKCTAGHASGLANEAHSSGQAVVFTGNLERCEHVDSILGGAPANLRTKIEEA